MNVTTQGIGHKVMSVLMALVLAIGLAPMVPAGTAWASVTDPEAWAAATATYAVGDVQYDADDEIVVNEGDVVSVASLKLVDQTVVDPEDYVVVYFEETNNDNKLSEGDKVVQAADTEDNVAGEMPIVEGDYYIVLVDAQDFVAIAGSIDNINNDWPWNAAWEGTQYKAKEFTVQAEMTSIEGAYAYQGTNAEVSEDTTFNYTGGALQVMFAVGDTPIKANVKWTKTPEGAGDPVWSNVDKCFPVTEAGTYVAELDADALEGDNFVGKATVTFTVEQADLATTEIAPATSLTMKDGVLDLVANNVLINGEKMDKDCGLTLTLASINGNTVNPNGYNSSNGTGKYTFRATVADADKANFANYDATSTYVDAYVVAATPAYEYSTTGKAITGTDAQNATDLGEFNASKGTYFTKDAITATVNKESVLDDTTIIVTKDGVEVNEFTEPGVYMGTIETAVAEDYAYAGYATFTFEVAGKDYSGAKVFLTWEGKNLEENANVVYDGNAVDPTVTVKLAGKTLVEGEDYAVELQDAEGNAVESAVDCGEYQIAVTFNGKYNGSWTETTVESHFNIVQATIVYAEAVIGTAYEGYPLPADGSAVVPAFKGYTATKVVDGKTVGTGDSFDLAASDIAVTYHKDGKEVAAADLTAAGEYTADITVKNTAKNLKGSVKGVPFIIADAVSFVDVDANEWYAEYIYEANQQHYMNGYNDTKLFVPNASITRAEIAQVIYNMAGAQGGMNLPNPDFDDVVADEWYEYAIAFVNAAGVMTGYDDTETFGVNDNATREQIATTMYRYAKIAGIDTTVEDEAAALAAYADSDQVSGFAKTAMAWAVENGIMGVDVTVLDPQGDVTRAQVAAISVRVQPNALENPVIPPAV